MSSGPADQAEDRPLPEIQKSPRQAANDAIDDSVDEDGDFADIQRTISQKRRKEKESAKKDMNIQEILPFQFSPNIRPLTVSDLDSCMALENAAFAEEHRASREKVSAWAKPVLATWRVSRCAGADLSQLEYRLTRCPEMCMGLFCTVVPSEAKGFEAETLASARLVETGRGNDAVSVLLAHVISTRSLSPIVTDADMDYPKDWRTRAGKVTDVGHQDAGRTVAVHSVAVLPKMQGAGLGKMLIKAYLQQVKDSDSSNRIALLCQDVSIRTICILVLPFSTDSAKVSRHILRAFRLSDARPEQCDLWWRRMA
jgi:GNAT superfamily N-acetyltransferase